MRFLPLALIAALSMPAFSQSSNDPRGAMPQSISEVATQDGWKFGIDTGLNTEWDFNHSMTGIEDGHYFKLAGQIKLTSTFLSGCFEWRNKLIIGAGFSKTPALEEFLKSGDQLSFESLALWSFGTWWGAFGQFNIDTTLFPGEDVRGRGDIDYIVYNFAGVPTTIVTDRYYLTGAFSPFYMKEQLGLFARLVTTQAFAWELKVGAYALQGLADGSHKVVAVDAGSVTVFPLGNFFQIGPMIGNFIYGDIVPKVLFYSASAELGYAAWESSRIPVQNDFIDHLYFNGNAAVTFKPAEWLALTWSIRMLYMPEIVKDLEIQSKLMVSFPFTI